MAPSNRRRSHDGSGFPPLPAAKKDEEAAARTFEKYRQQLQTLCADQDSQHRLTWLQRQFGKTQRGARESARAEIDIATLMVRAGSSVAFVKETGTRTADLECYFGHDRLFVEVTVIVPVESDRAKDVGSRHHLHAEEESADFWKDGLVKRMLARMREKAEQLAGYCAPVLLAVTLVHQEQSRSANGKNTARKLALDLQQVGGVVTQALASISPLSGVLLTLWDIQPAESRSNIRLANVHVGEWISDAKGFSQIRSLIVNPTAAYAMEPAARAALQRML